MKELELKDVLSVAGGNIVCTGNTHVTISGSAGNEGPTCDVTTGDEHERDEESIDP